MKTLLFGPSGTVACQQHPVSRFLACNCQQRFLACNCQQRFLACNVGKSAPGKGRVLFSGAARSAGGVPCFEEGFKMHPSVRGMMARGLPPRLTP